MTQEVAKRRVLVTGGTGFIGRHLIRRLAKEANLEVLSTPGRSFEVGMHRADRMDLSDAEQLNNWTARRLGEHVLHGIFHLAAVVPSRFDNEEARATSGLNVRMTESVVSVAEKHRCRRR